LLILDKLIDVQSAIVAISFRGTDTDLQLVVQVLQALGKPNEPFVVRSPSLVFVATEQAAAADRSSAYFGLHPDDFNSNSTRLNRSFSPGR
jgi:hypothetical protein